MQIGKNTQAIFIQDPSLDKEITLKIALIGDIHISDTEKEYEKIKRVLEKIETESPDLILFAGDYTSLPSSVSDMENHRFKIAKLLTKESNKKKVFILGNYESWSRPEAWVDAFKAENAIVLENEIRKVEIDGQTICIRGLGDYYTNRFEYIDYPKDCVRSGKITITHDPAGAFHNNVQGLVLAAHTLRTNKATFYWCFMDTKCCANRSNMWFVSRPTENCLYNSWCRYHDFTVENRHKVYLGFIDFDLFCKRKLAP